MGPKIYVLVTGEIYQKVKSNKIAMSGKAIDRTDTWAIGGPFDLCARDRFTNTEEWRCFDTLAEAREAASNLD